MERRIDNHLTAEASVAACKPSRYDDVIHKATTDGNHLERERAESNNDHIHFK
jgi:hypothetical protein